MKEKKIQKVQATHIRLEGFIDSETSIDFENSLAEFLAQGKRFILLDCCDLKYISDTGIGAILSTAKKFEENRSCLVFYNLPSELSRIVDFLHLDENLSIADTKEDALRLMGRYAMAQGFFDEEMDSSQSDPVVVDQLSQSNSSQGLLEPEHDVKSEVEHISASIKDSKVESSKVESSKVESSKVESTITKSPNAEGSNTESIQAENSIDDEALDEKRSFSNKKTDTNTSIDDKDDLDINEILEIDDEDQEIADNKKVLAMADIDESIADLSGHQSIQIEAPENEVNNDDIRQAIQDIEETDLEKENQASIGSIELNESVLKNEVDKEEFDKEEFDKEEFDKEEIRKKERCFNLEKSIEIIDGQLGDINSDEDFDQIEIIEEFAIIETMQSTNSIKKPSPASSITPKPRPDNPVIGSKAIVFGWKQMPQYSAPKVGLQNELSLSDTASVYLDKKTEDIITKSSIDLHETSVKVASKEKPNVNNPEENVIEEVLLLFEDTSVSDKIKADEDFRHIPFLAETSKSQNLENNDQSFSRAKESNIYDEIINDKRVIIKDIERKKDSENDQLAKFSQNSGHFALINQNIKPASQIEEVNFSDIVEDEQGFIKDMDAVGIVTEQDIAEKEDIRKIRFEVGDIFDSALENQKNKQNQIDEDAVEILDEYDILDELPDDILDDIPSNIPSDVPYNGTKDFLDETPNDYAEELAEDITEDILQEKKQSRKQNLEFSQQMSSQFNKDNNRLETIRDGDTGFQDLPSNKHEQSINSNIYFHKKAQLGSGAHHQGQNQSKSNYDQPVKHVKSEIDNLNQTPNDKVSEKMAKNPILPQSSLERIKDQSLDPLFETKRYQSVRPESDRFIHEPYKHVYDYRLGLRNNQLSKADYHNPQNRVLSPEFSHSQVYQNQPSVIGGWDYKDFKDNDKYNSNDLLTAIILVECVECGQVSKIQNSGKFACPNCHHPFFVDKNGKIYFAD